MSVMCLGSCQDMSLPRGDGEYGRELPVERRLPTVGGTSAELGDPEATLGNPIGLVLERLTVADLKKIDTGHTRYEIKVPKIQAVV